MNPFKYNGPIIKEDSPCGSTLVERSHIVNKILQFIQQGEYVQIIGPHQSGRTTLSINLIDRFISDDNISQNIPVRISCESLLDASPKGFIRTVIMRLHQVLKEYGHKEELYEIFSLLDTENNTPKTFTDLYFVLVKVGGRLRETTGHSGFVFLVDEIEALSDSLVVDVLRFFRGLFSHYAERRWESPYRVLIFSTHDLSYLNLGASSPYNISNVIPLIPFSWQELDTMLNDERVGKILPNITIDESARKKIMVESGGYSYFIQRLCHILIKRNYIDDEKITLSSDNILKAVLEIFEKGDESLDNLYQDISLESHEWHLCKRLVAGHKEPYAADAPAIKKLVELGIVSDVDHYCNISSRLYQRQILKIYFRQEYQSVIEPFLDNEQLLLNISCLQEILLNGEIKHCISTKIKSDMAPDSDEIPADLLSCLDKILKDKGPNLDMEEIRTYTDYYKIESTANREALLSLLLKVFNGYFRDIDSGAAPR